MNRPVAVSLALIGTILSSAPALAQAKRFDGTWSVEVVTEAGSCDRAYRYSVVLENGNARYGGPEAFNVQGRVQGNGAVRASIARGSNRAEVTGRLAGSRGTGTWTASGGRSCSGTWNAEKRR
jgi:hypothetical protein